jgi:hypothetical protein
VRGEVGDKDLLQSVMKDFGENEHPVYADLSGSHQLYTIS